MLPRYVLIYFFRSLRVSDIERVGGGMTSVKVGDRVEVIGKVMSVFFLVENITVPTYSSLISAVLHGR